MEYLVQYPIKTDLVSKNEVEFLYNDLKIRLFLDNLSIYTKSKKLHIIASADRPMDALKTISMSFHEFYDILVVYTMKNINIGHQEIILLNQKGSVERLILYDLINMPEESRDIENQYVIKAIIQLISSHIEPQDRQILYYLSRAVQSSHIYDKFLNAFHALDSLSTKSASYRKCNKCKALLICPECDVLKKCTSHSTNELCRECQPIHDLTTRFERTTEKGLNEAIAKIDLIGSFSAKELLKTRHLCAHPGKKGRIKYDFAESMAQQISAGINYYLTTKYGISFGGGGVFEYGSHTGFWQSTFKTKYSNAEFALDVPDMEYLKENGGMTSADL